MKEVLMDVTGSPKDKKREYILFQDVDHCERNFGLESLYTVRLNVSDRVSGNF